MGAAAFFVAILYGYQVVSQLIMLPRYLSPPTHPNQTINRPSGPISIRNFQSKCTNYTQIKRTIYALARCGVQAKKRALVGSAGSFSTRAFMALALPLSPHHTALRQCGAHGPRNKNSKLGKAQIGFRSLTDV